MTQTYDAQKKDLTGQLFPGCRIFLDNEAFAFFDVSNPYKPTDVADIERMPLKTMHKGYSYAQKYNFLVTMNDAHYFNIGDCMGTVCVMSVTSPCIFFSAYTTENGRVKSSGVHHDLASLKYDIHDLISTVRSKDDEKVTVKAAGSDSNDKKYLEEEKDLIIKILQEEDVIMEPQNLVLGGGNGRITEFYPQKGRLITYFADNIQKKIVL